MIFCIKQRPAYEMRIRYWISDVCSSDLPVAVQTAHGLISRAKNAGLSPEQALEASRSTREREAAALYAKYQARLSAFNAVDFDDLIRLPVELLENDADVALGWRERIGYLLVDECQDTNDAQYRMLKALAGDKRSEEHTSELQSLMRISYA